MESWWLFVGFVLLTLWYMTPRKPVVDDIPCPRRLPLLGHLLTSWMISKRRLDYSSELTEQLGPVWKFDVPGQRFVLLASEENVEHILRGNFSNYVKGKEVYDRFVEILGDGIFNVDGPLWRVQRKAASHMFSVNEMKGFMASVFQRHARPLLEVIDSHRGRPFDIHELFHKYTLDSICEIAFGVNIDSMHSSDNPFALYFDPSLALITQRFFAPWFRLGKWVSPKEFQLRSNIAKLDAFAQQVIEAKRNTPMTALNANDVLTRFMQLRDDNGRPFSDKYLRDLILNFIIAGRDTTAQTMSWTAFMLCEHPEVQRRVADEVEAELEGGVPTYEGVQKLVYTQAVVNEVLRLYPPVPIDLKFALEDDVLPSGHHVTKGDFVGYLPYAMGRRTELWGADAREFKPERWLGDAPRPSAFKYPVFQAGPRICLGMNMAQMEVKMVLAYVLQRHELRMVPGHRVHYADTITLQMESGLLVEALPRTRE